MKHYIFLAMILVTAGCSKKKLSPSTQLETPPITADKKINFTPEQTTIAQTIYGKNGLQLSLDQVFFIQDLIETLATLSDEEKKETAAQAAWLLEKDLGEHDPVKQMVYTYVICYLQNYSQLPKKTEHSMSENIIKTAKKIVEYSDIEQANIFITQKNIQLFLTLIKKNKLPDIINFWSTPQGEKILENYDKPDDVKIQFMADMIIDMSIMLGTQMGASMANAVIGTEAQMLSEKISKNSQALQTSIQAFQTKSQLDQQKKMQAMLTAFSNAQKTVQAQIQQGSIISNIELDYLYKSISINQPQQNYIFNQIQYDQAFSLGTMLTPQGALWKNPFSVGDWEYEGSSNSFWQYQSSPIFNTTTDDSGNTTSSSLQAENNSIFTEYFTNSPIYTIEGSIALTAINYPFFAGIIFNKARWISGDFEAIRKCRMVGVYGNSASDIGVYFAQQYTMTDAQIKATNSQNPIQTPLQQIISNQTPQLIKVTSDQLSTIQTAPVICTFKITNSPTTVTITFSINGNPPTSSTIPNLDPAIYTYHGIGFICPGAIAEFTLTQPEDLIFTPQAVSNYKD